MKRLRLVLLLLAVVQISFAKKEKWNLVSKKEINGAKISVFKRIDDSSVRTNPEGVKFLNTNIKLELEINGEKQKVKIPEAYFLTEKKEYLNMPRTFFHSNTLYIFVFEKSEEVQHFGMKGDVYAYKPASKELKKTTIFSRANWGWYSYFEIVENGGLELRCFLLLVAMI
jgi:hypothetical protein